MSTTNDPKDPRLQQIREDGLQEAYLVLSPDEIEKGYVRPVRTEYVHDKCGAATEIGLPIAKTYARDPFFYGSTFCAMCRDHYPVAEFKWNDGFRVGS